MKSLVRFAVIISFFGILLLSFQRIGSSAPQGLTLTVTEPADRSYTNQTKITIAGNVNTEGATVTANGTDLAVASDNTFRGQISLPSEGPNPIEVRATVGAKSVVTVTRTVFRDTIAPTILISQPADGATIDAAQVEVRGSAADASGFTITVNGVPAKIVGGKDALWFVTVPLVGGSNTLRAVVRDAAGNTAEQTRTVIRSVGTDTLRLTVTGPENNSFVNTNPVQVSGSVSSSGTQPIQVTVNGTTLVVNTDGTFSGQLSCTEGPNTLNVVATSGNQSVQSARAITVDTIAPVIAITSPIEGATTPQEEITVTGTVTDANATGVTVNNIPVVRNGANFSVTVPLLVGTNALYVEALDEALNQAQVVRSVTRLVPLALQVDQPTEGQTLGRETVFVSGQVAGTGVTVTANGTALTVSNDEFSGEITVLEGSRTVQFVARDASNNQVTVTRTVTVDLTPPVISNLTPADGTLVSGATATIQGLLADASVTQVTVKNLTVTVPAGGGSFAIPNVPLAEGENVLEIRAVDAMGNDSVVELRLTGPDRTPPAAPRLFAVSSPTRLSYQTIGGSAEPGATVRVTANGTTVTTAAGRSNGLFFAQVNLNSGPNPISVVALDAAGNSSPPVQVSVLSDPNIQPPAAGQAWQINLSLGGGQWGLVNTELPRPLVAIVTDVAGNPVANVPVQFTVLLGGGTLVGGTATLTVPTNAGGRASARYVAGNTPGLHTIRADFAGNSAASTHFLAKTFAPPANGVTRVVGVVMDQNTRALPNVIVRLGGQQTRTGTDGQFVLSNVASGPNQVLELIGRDQVPFAGRWPNISFDLDVLPGMDNSLGRPLFLPRVNEGTALPLNASNQVTQDTSVEQPVVGGEPPIRLTARAGTQVTFAPDVSDRRLSVTRIPANRVPMGLEDGLVTNLYVSVQPAGAIFDPPLEVTFPNFDQLAANAPVRLMSFDHDAGRYVQVGTGHVSADGKTVTSDPGSGIRIGAWHGFPPAAPPPDSTVGGGPVPGGDGGCGPSPVPAGRDAAPEFCYTCQPYSSPNRGVDDGGLVFVTRPFTPEPVDLPVMCEEKPNPPSVKITKVDERFAPSAETCDIKYTISPDGATVENAKLEIFKNGDPANPIYKDEAIPKTGKDVTVMWDGKANQGADSGKFVHPKDSPFTIRITVSGQVPAAYESKGEKQTRVEIESITQNSPKDAEFKIYKQRVSQVEIDTEIEIEIRIKNKLGKGVTTEIPFKVDWSFEDPDDTAGGQIDPNGSGDDNAPVAKGGKSIVNGGTSIMWKASVGVVTNISADGQSADVMTQTSSTDKGKAKISFSASVVSGDNYKLIAEVKNPGQNAQPLKKKTFSKWSVWKKHNFQNIYLMKKGLQDIGSIMSTGNVKGAFDGDGYTEYTASSTVTMLSQADSPQFIVPLIAPTQAQLPTQQELNDYKSNNPAVKAGAKMAIEKRAQDWYDSNLNSVSAAFRNFIRNANIVAPAVVGANAYHPKLDAQGIGNIDSSPTGQTNYYPPGIEIMVKHGNGTRPRHPDKDWYVPQGYEIDDVAFVFLNVGSTGRKKIVGRHEAGHASDHISFGLTEDHATSGLMERSAGQSQTIPDGVDTFSDDSILRLRGRRR